MSAKAKILVVEDEADVRDLILMHLGRDGHDAHGVENGEEALKFLEEGSYALVVLDWMLPGLSGLEICRKINRKMPVLMLTARADTADIVLGLEVGADDYLTKPLEISVFLARVRALLRRGNTLAEAPGLRSEVGGITLDAETHRVVCEGQVLELTISEFKLVRALLDNQG